MADPNPNPPEQTVAATAPKPAAAVAARPAAAKPPARGKPRRNFLLAMVGSWLAIGFLTLTASLVGMVLGTVRFLFPNVLSEPPSKFKAGFPYQYEDGKVTDRFKDQNAWVIRDRDDKGRDTIYALSTTCTHLGCTPNWLEREQKFKCPCHGSGYYITGVNFEGPAPRPLERWAVSVGDDGQIVVDKSKKFQKELGQWDNPESYILV
jgi:cytochrome b6-f complex iron-sulfur subunit